MGIPVCQKNRQGCFLLHTTFKKIPTWDDCCKLYTGLESAGRGAKSKKIISQATYYTKTLRSSVTRKQRGSRFQTKE